MPYADLRGLNGGGFSSRMKGMKMVAETLRVFYGDPDRDHGIDRDILSLPGEPTGAKKWLAASLGKTISLQLRL